MVLKMTVPIFILLMLIYTHEVFSNTQVTQVPIYIKSDSKRKAQNYIQNIVSKKFREQFYFLTYILPDNVFHESIKEFWQNSHFENMRAGFLKVFKTHFGKLALK